MNTRIDLSAVGAVLLILAVSGCASRPYQPSTSDLDTLLGRAEFQSEQGITVSAAVPSPEEAARLFDLPLYDRGIQPIWLEVRNDSTSQIRYAPVGTDPDYFSAQEVAYVHRSGFSGEAQEEMTRYFYEQMMPRRIPAGESRSGFIFTHVHHGTKLFNVDLFGATPEDEVSFTFLIDVPGFEPDQSADFFEALYPPEKIIDLSTDEFRAALAAMLRDQAAEGSRAGPPINAAIVGQPERVLQALIRAGWVEQARSEGELTSDVERFDGRIADVVFSTKERKDGSGVELKVWLSPLREAGSPVWLAQVRHLIGKRRQLDPDLDDAATFFLHNIWYGQGLQQFGWLQVREGTTFENPALTASGQEHFSAGAMVVLWMSGDTRSMLDVEQLSWDASPNGRGQ